MLKMLKMLKVSGKIRAYNPQIFQKLKSASNQGNFKNVKNMDKGLSKNVLKPGKC